MITIVTHPRKFHNDELMAIMLLQHYNIVDKKVNIIRTRDAKIIEKHQNDENSFVIDVGFKYDPDMKNFDHHQQDFDLTWEDGTPMSSCGIVWKWLHETKVFTQFMNDDLRVILENDIIKPVDAQDNGKGFWDDGAFLSKFNRKHDDNNVIDRQFKMALAAANSFYINHIYHLKAEIRAKKEIAKEMKKSDQYKNTVVFKTSHEGAVQAVQEHTDKSWVILPYKKGVFQVKAVPNSNGRGYRKSVPSEWLGLKDSQLKKVSQIKNLVFCHKNGFVFAFEGELKELLWLTEGILN